MDVRWLGRAVTPGPQPMATEPAASRPGSGPLPGSGAHHPDRGRQPDHAALVVAGLPDQHHIARAVPGDAAHAGARGGVRQRRAGRRARAQRSHGVHGDPQRDPARRGPLFPHPPVQYVLVRVVGAALPLAWRNRRSPIKLVFNIAMYWLEAVVAVSRLAPHRRRRTPPGSGDLVGTRARSRSSSSCSEPPYSRRHEPRRRPAAAHARPAGRGGPGPPLVNACCTRHSSMSSPSTGEPCGRWASGRRGASSPSGPTTPFDGVREAVDQLGTSPVTWAASSTSTRRLRPPPPSCTSHERRSRRGRVPSSSPAGHDGGWRARGRRQEPAGADVRQSAGAMARRPSRSWYPVGSRRALAPPRWPGRLSGRRGHAPPGDDGVMGTLLVGAGSATRRPRACRPRELQVLGNHLAVALQQRPPSRPHPRTCGGALRARCTTT